MNKAPRPQTKLSELAANVREFNRFYTQHLGILQRGILGTRFSLSEARILYELAQADGLTASELADKTGLDSGYLSRALSGFEAEGLLDRKRSTRDGRQRPLHLTRSGRREFEKLDKRSQQQVEEMLRALSPSQRETAVRSMRVIKELISGHSPNALFILRDPRPGDFGWIIARHGALYMEEYQRNQMFEGLVTQTVADFLKAADKTRAHCWIAEKGGENVGCVLLVQRASRVAELRLLLVEPSARGKGLGTRLVEECIRFSTKAGYAKIIVSSSSILKDAARLWRRMGFRVVAEKSSRSSGHDLAGQTWELDLERGRSSHVLAPSRRRQLRDSSRR
jgi:DNA-binding MarR family transcriptional regulator/N-acetylglutamate synthase-like GNAT family acetyltransferase